MLSRMEPHNILTVLTRLEHDLPTLVGESGWEAIQKAVQARMSQLCESKDPVEQQRLAVELLETLAPYDDARERLQLELYLLADLRGELRPILETLASELGLDDNVVDSSLIIAFRQISVDLADSETVTGVERYLVTEPGGVGGAKIIRLKNLRLDLGNLLELAAGTIMTGADIVSQPHPLVISAGILLTVRSLLRATTIDVNEQDASVFWGVLTACGRRNRLAAERAIIQQTNKARERYRLLALSDDAIRHSLNTLARLKVIELEPGDGQPMWRFVERCRIQE